MPDGAEPEARAPVLRDAVYGVALLLMVGWLLYVGRGLFVPIVLSLLVIYIIVGTSRLTSRLPVVGRLLPIGVHYLIAALVIALLLVELVAVFTANLTALAARAPLFQDALIALIQKAVAAVDIDATVTWDMVRREALSEVNLQRTLRSGLSSVAGMLAGLFVVLLNVTFMMLEQRSFYGKLARLGSDPAQSARILSVVQDINDRVGRYLAVKTMINIVLGVASYVIMAVAGLEFAVFWAIIIAVLNYIPYIGSIVGVTFPVAMALVQFPEIDTVLLLAVALIAAQVTMGNVIEPFVMGTSLNLSPYVILVSLTAWSALWGIAGAIVSVPVTAVMVIVFSEFRTTRPFAVLLSKNGDIDGR